jgi:hypothetical protein
VSRCLQPFAHSVSSLADFHTLKMEAKRRFTQYLHGATSQKTAFFIVTAVKTSNLTSALLVCDTVQFCGWIPLFRRNILVSS